MEQHGGSLELHVERAPPGNGDRQQLRRHRTQCDQDQEAKWRLWIEQIDRHACLDPVQRGFRKEAGEGAVGGSPNEADRRDGEGEQPHHCRSMIEGRASKHRDHDDRAKGRDRPNEEGSLPDTQRASDGHGGQQGECDRECPVRVSRPDDAGDAGQCGQCSTNEPDEDRSVARLERDPKGTAPRRWIDRRPACGTKDVGAGCQGGFARGEPGEDWCMVGPWRCASYDAIVRAKRHHVGWASRTKQLAQIPPTRSVVRVGSGRGSPGLTLG